MTFTAGYKTLFKKGGTPTTFTAEACTEITTDKVFQITDVNKRIWDINPATIFTVLHNGVAVSSADIDYIDLLQGIIAFKAANKTGAVTVTGKYIPVTTITYANEAGLKILQEIIDITTFASLVDNNDFRSRQATLKDVSLSLSGFFETSSLFYDTLNNGEDVLIEASIRDATKKIKGWFKSESFEVKIGVADIIGQSISFQGNDKSYNGGAFPRRGFFVFN